MRWLTNLWYRISGKQEKDRLRQAFIIADLTQAKSYSIEELRRYFGK